MSRLASLAHAAAALLAVAAALARTASAADAPLSSDALFSPEWRGKTISTEGVVHNAASLPGGGMLLEVYRTVAAFSVIVSNASGMRTEDLEDAFVSVTGRLEVRFGPDGVPDGVQLFAPDASAVSVLRPPPADPYALEPVEIGSIRFAPGEARAHRVHVKGVVIFSREIDTSFMLHLEEGRNVCVVPTDRSEPLPKKGDIVDVCGFLALVNPTPRLDDSLVRVVGHDDAAVPTPRRLPIAEIVAMPYAIGADADSLYAQTVETEGFVREVNRREKFMQVFITDGVETLLVLVPCDQSLPTPDGFAAGARVKAVGNISFYRRGGLLLSDRPTPHQNLTLHTESVEAVEVVARAPFWTARRTWILLCVVLLAIPFAGFILALAVRHVERTRYDATRRERLRLSHDLHDNLQQILAATKFRLDAAENLVDADLPAAREQISWAKKAVEGAQAGLRSILWDLREESEGPESLAGLLRYAVGRMPHWAGKVSVETHGSEPEGARVFGGRFLMILQEAVGNALSRGRARHVRVRLFFRRGLVRLAVSDDGCGFSPDDVPGEREGHLGLASMAKRAGEIGGTLVVKSEIGKGTLVMVEIPM